MFEPMWKPLGDSAAAWGLGAPGRVSQGDATAGGRDQLSPKPGAEQLLSAKWAPGEQVPPAQAIRRTHTPSLLPGGLLPGDLLSGGLLSRGLLPGDSQPFTPAQGLLPGDSQPFTPARGLLPGNRLPSAGTRPWARPGRAVPPPAQSREGAESLPWEGRDSQGEWHVRGACDPHAPGAAVNRPLGCGQPRGQGLT